MIGDFRIDLHEPSGQHMLYVEAGTDPMDGLPLTAARVATHTELHLWERGKLDKLARVAQATCPIRLRVPADKKRPWWRRLLSPLRGKRR